MLEAKREGLPISTFLNKIVERHFLMKKSQAHLGCILCSPYVCTPIVAMIEPDKLTIAAQTAAHDMSKKILFAFGNSIKIESLLAIVNKIFENPNITYYYFNDPPHNFTLLFNNSAHPRWTVYFVSFIEALFQDVFKISITCKVCGNLIKVSV